MVLHHLPLHRLRAIYRPRMRGRIATYRLVMCSLPYNLFYGILAQPQCSISRYQTIITATIGKIRALGRRLYTTQLRLYETICGVVRNMGDTIQNTHYGGMCRI